MAAINGGTFMLNRSVDEILFDADGKAWGIRGGNEVVLAAADTALMCIFHITPFSN